jgi:hypothetical protein
MILASCKTNSRIIGALKPGDQIRARFAQFFRFKDGLIWRQRNYDCFDPW